MSDYISREAAIQITVETGALETQSRLRELLAADVAPVKHGNWWLDPNGMDWNLPAWKCDQCGCKNDMIPPFVRGKDGPIQVNPYLWSGSNYCPSCGAKMG